MNASNVSGIFELDARYAQLEHYDKVTNCKYCTFWFLSSVDVIHGRLCVFIANDELISIQIQSDSIWELKQGFPDISFKKKWDTIWSYVTGLLVVWFCKISKSLTIYIYFCIHRVTAIDPIITILFFLLPTFHECEDMLFS